MEILNVFVQSYFSVIIPVSFGVFLVILYGIPSIGMATFLSEKATPLLAKKHKTKKDIKDLIWMIVFADALLILLFTFGTYWLMSYASYLF